MKLKTISQIIELLEEHTPSGTAETWDNVGLLVGDPDWKTAGAVVSVDLTAEALSEAKRRGYKLIINHHPCIFPGGRGKGLGRIVLDRDGSSKASLIFKAIQEGIAVAAYHTNFDRCALEVIEKISKGLDVTPLGRLFDHPQSLLKLVVFVPETHAELVRAALAQAGAGHIGNYDSCSFEAAGVGRFRGAAGSKPRIGQPGRLEAVAEVRIETVFPRGLDTLVLQAMRAVHPYEEVAYDLYPLEQTPRSPGLGLARGVGYGFWGEFKKPRPFSAVMKDVKKIFQVNGFLLTDPAPKLIKRLAFAAGKGASVVDSAARSGCDLLITGEAGYHDAISVSKYRGNPKTGRMAVMELGHRESERFFSVVVSEWISEAGLKALPLETRTQKIHAI
jgi:dinuclear metal center YbgI/SA1388 family protein